MKTKFRGGWKLACLLAALPLVAASLQSPESSAAGDAAAMAEDTNNAPPVNITTDETMTADAATTASGTNPPAPNVKLSTGAAEVVRLAQAGVGEDVMLAYIHTVDSQFNLGTDQIIYLNDIGVSGSVVKAMMDRDGTIDAASRAAYAASLAPAQTAPLPDANAAPDDNMAPPPPVDDSGAMANPPDSPDYVGDPTAVDDTGYFYNSLAPYGSWTYVAGCGVCWQPTVCVRNHDWRPYCDRGRWVYSDCGWYWQSDYSWGWAAFHYGRWFCDEHRGWCWAPNRVWGPAWVTWRHTEDHCGWAPLPPGARIARGGVYFRDHAVGANFDFGLNARHFTFIPVERMTDYAPSRYAVGGDQRGRIFNHSAVDNNITVENHRVFNHGLDPRVVSAASGSPVRQAVIRDLPASQNGFRADHIERQGGTMTIFRPQLQPPQSNRRADMPAGGNPGGGVAPGNSTQVVTLTPRNATAVPNSPNVTIRGANGGQYTGNTQAAAMTPAVRSGQTPRPLVYPHDAPTATRPETYPANSLVVIGHRDNNAQPAAQLPAPTVTSGQTATPNTMSRAFQPRVVSQPAQTMPNAGQQGGPQTGAQWSNRSMPVQSQSPAPANGNYNFNRNYAASYSQAAPAAPVQAATPRTESYNFSRSYAQPNNYTPAPAYSAPQNYRSDPAPAQTYRPAPVNNNNYSPTSSHATYSAPAPAPAPAPVSHSAPSQSSNNNSQQRGRR
jgi:hypothetical protein